MSHIRPKPEKSLGSSRETGYDVVLEAALVDAAQDLEVAAIAPVLVPRVGHQPVRRAVLNAPPEQPYRVAAEVPAGRVLVHARLVRQEVLVHFKRYKRENTTL